MKQIMTIFLAVCSILFASCYEDEIVKWEGEGMKPVYVSPDNMDVIKFIDVQANQKVGNTFVQGDFLYQVEHFKGIHIHKLLGSSHSKVGFWYIPGCTEFTVKDDLLYTDNSRHLITIDISDYKNIKVLSKVDNVYSSNKENVNYPPAYKGKFECVEFEKGIVVDWELSLLKDPQCFTK